MSFVHEHGIVSREDLETLRLEHQASKIEADNIEDKIKQSNLNIQELLTELDEEQSVEYYQSELEKIEKKIFI